MNQRAKVRWEARGYIVTLAICVIVGLIFSTYHQRITHNGHPVYKLENIPDRFAHPHWVWWADGFVQTNYYYPMESGIPHTNGVLIILGFTDDGVVVWKERKLNEKGNL